MAGQSPETAARVGQDVRTTDHLVQLEMAADGFARVLADGDLSAPVRPCPGWRLVDLGEHLGRIHQWANHAIVAGNPDAVTTGPPAGRAGLVAWYRSAAGALLATLAGTDPDRPAWTFGPKPRLVSC